MSEPVPSVDAVNPARGREPRSDVVKRERRRRRGGTLNRMVQMKLDVFDPGQLDLENYVYRWSNDEDNRLAMLTRGDDYDFVGVSEIKGFDQAHSVLDGESEERVCQTVGTNKGGQRVKSYLLKKPRDYWEADQEEMVKAREALMAGRVYQGEADFDDKEDAKAGKTFYVPESANVSIGSAGERRKGPVTRTKG